MSEEIRKKIDFSVKSFKPESGQTAFKIVAEFGYQLAQEELNKAFREGVEQGYRQATSKEPYNEASQDELWEELIIDTNIVDFFLINIEEAKKTLPHNPCEIALYLRFKPLKF